MSGPHSFLQFGGTTRNGLSPTPPSSRGTPEVSGGHGSAVTINSGEDGFVMARSVDPDGVLVLTTWLFRLLTVLRFTTTTPGHRVMTMRLFRLLAALRFQTTTPGHRVMTMRLFRLLAALRFPTTTPGHRVMTMRLFRLLAALRFPTTTPGHRCRPFLDGNYYNDCKLAALAGLADCATGIAALVYNRPSSDGPVYLVGVGIVLVAGVAEMLAALWVAYDVRNRGAAGRKIMYVSVFMLVLGIVVGIFAYRLKK
ncbi:uncharacterized protein [Triticum aestivum]|uniref:uncharacterized protein isoform X1 n=1 Tax=Triticum aestivum TaxID=4565 RepID=UPI001D008EE1|nr:uncharacterized protein LOC123111485 isoform X1 [Triticum aestivum]